MKAALFLIIFYSLGLVLLIPTLIVVKWENLHIVNLIFFLMMTSFNFLGLIFAIFIHFKKYCLDIKNTSICCYIISALVYLSINIAEIICIFIFIDKANYPCKKLEKCTQSNPCVTDYYYYTYYYYRRLIPEYDCDKLPEDFYTGIITKKESTLAYITVFFSIFFDIIITVFWYKTADNYYSYNYEPCDCSSCKCDCSSCCCAFSCFKKSKEKKKVDIKVDIQNTDTNNIKTLPDIEIHPTEAKSKEPIQEKIAQ